MIAIAASTTIAVPVIQKPKEIQYSDVIWHKITADTRLERGTRLLIRTRDGEVRYCKVNRHGWVNLHRRRKHWCECEWYAVVWEPLKGVMS